MKEETKELVEFIKQQMNCVKDEAIKQNAQSAWWFCEYDKAIKFLDSLPEIELQLCRGGYIQDKNGVPCRERDKIRATTSDGSFEAQGILTWANYYFYLYDEKKGYCNHLLNSNYIYEKVEK